ncbi:hypothetical protein [Campylobacter sp. RM16192]|uniref:hypothetical protein n=1 Tax=Campylobacter sp. RM16192 TaxID=1660080 RepID=UPI0014526957|nr:hypothetical protein [Campylobacter sp. RM16192]QCD52522.1 hypothetical protein CDOMC_0899 [Campylobacter sp. RM16192]
MTAREFLGNDLITSFEKAGFSPESINTFAKTEYMKQKSELEKKQRELESRVEASNLNDELKAKVIAGDIDEKTAFEAQKIDDIRGWAGIGKGVVKGVASIYNAAEEVVDRLNPFYEGQRDENGKYIHKNPIGKALKPHIEKVERLEKSWAKAHPDEWNIKGAVGEMFGSLATDPINFIPLASGANLGRKALYYASTGALSNAIYGTGIDEDKNVFKDAAIGAGGGVLLGGVMELAAKGISRLIAKAKDARIKEATSQADIDALNNDDFSRVDAASRVGKPNEQEGFGVKEYIDFYLHNSGEDVRRQVYNDYLAGKEKSVIDDEKFNDIKNFKSGIEFLSNPSKAEEYFAPLQMERDAVMDSIYKAKESSLTQYADMQKTTHKIVKENPNLRPRMLTELVNLAHKPTKEEAFITSLINNGQGVENRFSGYRILYAIENSFVFNTPTDMFYARLKKAGFTDEAAEAFTDSYAKKDLNIANEFIGVKVDEEGEKFILDRFIKTKEAEARINENSRAEGAGEAGRVQNSLFGLGDNASRAEAGQAGDAQIPQNGRPDSPVGSEDAGRAKIDEAVEERGAVKFDDADNARISPEQVVSKENFSIDEKIIGEWKKEFNLKSVYDDYIAQIPSQVKEILGGAVRLKFGSLVKLVGRKRTEFVSLIKPTLEKPDFVVKDGDGYIFIKDIGDKKAVFTSITKDSGGEYVVSSNSLKKISTLQNKIDSGAEVIFKSGEASNILAEAFTGKTFHAKPLSKDIIPQNGGYDTTIGNKQEENTGIIQTFIPQGSKSAGELGLPTNLNKISDEAEVIFKSGVFEKDSAFASRTDFGKTPIKANVKTATSSDTVRSSGALKPIEHSSDKGIISKKIKNGEDIDFSDKKVVNEIQKSVDNFVKDSLQDINVKDEILREFDLKNVKTLAKGKSIDLNEAQIKTLKKDISNSQIKSINENKFYFDKVGKGGDKRRYFVDFDESGAVKIDGFSKADIDEIPVRKSAMDELMGKDKLKGMSFEEKAAYHNELDPIKKEKIVKTAELNRLKREVRGIANVAFNDKKSTLVNKDLSAAEEFIKFEKGIENPVSKKGFGAEHIKKHLDPKESGFVTKKEYLKMGDVIRNGEMSLKDGKRIYEAYNDEGVRFRVIAGEKNGKERIISFFSNRKPGIENNTLTYNYSGHNEIINFKSKKQLIAERKFEEFKAKNLDEDGNIKDGLELC